MESVPKPLSPVAERFVLDVTRPNGADSLTVDAEDATERGVDGSAADVEGIVAFAAETDPPNVVAGVIVAPCCAFLFPSHPSQPQP
mmetsp:Transcript_9546/g.37207  ORF Transcript_9546/g.37207 Transcript_9546/m.37207 type:complete len:86 (+) Transcript_9546:1739-1996(+)